MPTQRAEHERREQRLDRAPRRSAAGNELVGGDAFVDHARDELGRDGAHFAPAAARSGDKRGSRRANAPRDTRSASITRPDGGWISRSRSTPSPRGDVDTGAAGGHDRAGPAPAGVRDGGGLPDAQPSTVVEPRLGDRPRIEGAHASLELRGRRPPVERGFGLRDLRRERSRARRAAARIELPFSTPGNAASKASAASTASRRGARPRFRAGRSRRAREMHGPGIETGVHLHDADARRRIAGEHGALDRRRTAPARQHRGMKIDATESRPVEQRARQQQAVRDHDHDVGSLAESPAAPGSRNDTGCATRKLELERGCLHGRCREPPTPARGTIGLRQYERDARRPALRSRASSARRIPGCRQTLCGRQGSSTPPRRAQITGTELRARALSGFARRRASLSSMPSS